MGATLPRGHRIGDTDQRLEKVETLQFNELG